MAKNVEALRKKVAAICAKLPGFEMERYGLDHSTLRVGKKTFGYFLNDHHGDGRIAIWCKAPPGAQAFAVDSDPDNLFIPPYVGVRGWIGARLDRDLDWEIVASFLRDAYEMTAPKRKKKK